MNVWRCAATWSSHSSCSCRRGSKSCEMRCGERAACDPAVLRGSPRSPTFHVFLHIAHRGPRHVLRRVRLSPTGIGDASEAPHRAITLPTRSAEPRAQRERTLPVCHSPDGRTQRPLPTGRAAMAENSVKQAESAETYKMADELLARAKPGHHRTSPGDPPRPRHAVRTVPTR